jgi:uncharacterized protein involved in outer membrane biogenesis
MTKRKVIAIAFSAIAIPVTLITIIIGILSYANITVPLEGVRQQFIKKATATAGHEVHIDGEVRLAISFYPTLVVDRLYIANEAGWSTENILTITEVRVQLALLPIISGLLEFTEVSASSVQINLEQAKDGKNNWSAFISSGDKSQTEQRDKVNRGVDSSNKQKGSNTRKTNLWIEEFRFTDLKINYLDHHLDREFNSRIDDLVINTREKHHLTASLKGTTNDIPYALEAKADLLRNLINNKPWQTKLQG